MAKIDDLKVLLADKYGKKSDDIEGTTLVTDIVNDKKLASHVKETFGKELSSSDLESITDITSLAELL